MNITLNTKSFFETSTNLTDGNTLILCNKSKGYLRCIYKNMCENINLNLSEDIIDLINSKENNIIRNGIKIKIFKKSDEEVYTGFMINKITSEYYLISINKNIPFEDYHINFANNTVYFLEKLLKKSR